MLLNDIFMQTWTQSPGARRPCCSVARESALHSDMWHTKTSKTPIITYYRTVYLSHAYELTSNHCMTKQPQPLRCLPKKHQMDYKDESTASQREPQPSAMRKGWAREEANHHTRRESQLLFWNIKHEKKIQEVRRRIACKWMQTLTCDVIMMGTVANAAVSIPVVGHHTRGAWDQPQGGEISCTDNIGQMGINKEIWQIPQVKEKEEPEGYSVFETNSHFEQQYAISHKIMIELKTIWSGVRNHSKPSYIWAVVCRRESRMLTSGCKNAAHYFHSGTGRMAGRNVKRNAASAIWHQDSIMQSWCHGKIARWRCGWMRRFRRTWTHIQLSSSTQSNADVRLRVRQGMPCLRRNQMQAERKIKQTYDKLVGYMTSYNSRIEKAVEQENEMIEKNCENGCENRFLSRVRSTAMRECKP